ncbi:hypothetical protein A2160_01705 [Candidatus Beckwithbacteria bacterium RBG_13_42_9]|uniref:Uncharacterized protein n=1 Tax=Candidatus Beckwithbacteria bacterium RBG_13_42_9 TaxID=1797457 RepID=A0A1F5E3W6_9BACT|nr:MAG: hypothetical protein A2160_01705 [Candidatus Beckwithbacteria bacterium RBG_13_42_9]
MARLIGEEIIMPADEFFERSGMNADLDAFAATHHSFPWAGGRPPFITIVTGGSIPSPYEHSDSPSWEDGVSQVIEEFRV